MFTNRKWCIVAFTRGKFHRKCSRHLSFIMGLKITNLRLQSHFPGANELNQHHTTTCILFNRCLAMYIHKSEETHHDWFMQWFVAWWFQAITSADPSAITSQILWNTSEQNLCWYIEQIMEWNWVCLDDTCPSRSLMIKYKSTRMCCQ